MSHFFASKGVEHQTSCIETPEQNGLVERKHQHLLNVARALKFQSNTPLCYWGYCVLQATHLVNITPTPLLNNKTPFEQLFHKTPIYKSVKVFGCLAYVNTSEHNRGKFDYRSRKCIHLGNAVHKKGYILLDLSSRKIFVSRNVIFQETESPFFHSNAGSSSHTASTPSIPIPENSTFFYSDPDYHSVHDHSIIPS